MDKLTFKEVVGGLCFFVLLFTFYHLEYDTIKAKTFLYPLFWISIAYIFIKKFRRKSTLRTFIFSVGGVIYFFIALNILTDLTGFCAWGHSNILYINKSNKSVKIDCRFYECFMTSGDCEMYKVNYITTHIKWVTKFNENPVDTTKWEKAPFMLDESNNK
jgi:hypothetical protein